MVLKAALVKRCRRRADFCDAVPWRFAVSAIRLHIAVVTLSQSRYAHELQCRTTVSAIEANLTSCLREKWNEKRKNAGVELNVLDLDDWVTVNSVAPQIRRPKKETKTAGKTEKTVNQPEAPRFVAPQHKPFPPCFMRTHTGKPGKLACGQKILECEDFMLKTNQERLELLFIQHRYFGCFLPLSVAGNLKLLDCPHPRKCSICSSTDHHQILCAPRRAYKGILPEEEVGVGIPEDLSRRKPFFQSDEDISPKTPHRSDLYSEKTKTEMVNRLAARQRWNEVLTSFNVENLGPNDFHVLWEFSHRIASLFDFVEDTLNKE
ncbi:hypothetical protein OUZ56_009916 [Daphnia magna]|uniref:Uncharacterized protein n=1 Tax=Daphnia magna TaxID=35525 RepID=A0ABR0AHM6_9CRUS|nr:hypothetical protein OUZ56_009916 [Daphnia magna]